MRITPKIKSTLGLAVGMFLAAAAVADTVELQDIGKKVLEGGKVAFVHLDKIPESNYFVGYRIDIEKKAEGELHGRISTVTLEGFVMLEEGKMSPLTQFKESKFVISKAGSEWTTLTVFKDTKLLIRWTK